MPIVQPELQAYLLNFQNNEETSDDLNSSDENDCSTSSVCESPSSYDDEETEKDYKQSQKTYKESEHTSPSKHENSTTSSNRKRKSSNRNSKSKRQKTNEFQNYSTNELLSNESILKLLQYQDSCKVCEYSSYSHSDPSRSADKRSLDSGVDVNCQWNKFEDGGDFSNSYADSDEESFTEDQLTLIESVISQDTPNDTLLNNGSMLMTNRDTFHYDSLKQNRNEIQRNDIESIHCNFSDTSKQKCGTLSYILDSSETHYSTCGTFKDNQVIKTNQTELDTELSSDNPHYDVGQIVSSSKTCSPTHEDEYLETFPSSTIECPNDSSDVSDVPHSSIERRTSQPNVEPLSSCTLKCSNEFSDVPYSSIETCCTSQPNVEPLSSCTTKCSNEFSDVPYSSIETCCTSQPNVEPLSSCTTKCSNEFSDVPGAHDVTFDACFIPQPNIEYIDIDIQQEVEIVQSSIADSGSVTDEINLENDMEFIKKSRSRRRTNSVRTTKSPGTKSEQASKQVNVSENSKTNTKTSSTMSTQANEQESVLEKSSKNSSKPTGARPSTPSKKLGIVSSDSTLSASEEESAPNKLNITLDNNNSLNINEVTDGFSQTHSKHSSKGSTEPLSSKQLTGNESVTTAQQITNTLFEKTAKVNSKNDNHSKTPHARKSTPTLSAGKEKCSTEELELPYGFNLSSFADKETPMSAIDFLMQMNDDDVDDAIDHMVNNRSNSFNAFSSIILSPVKNPSQKDDDRNDDDMTSKSDNDDSVTISPDKGNEYVKNHKSLTLSSVSTVLHDGMCNDDDDINKDKIDHGDTYDSLIIGQNVMDKNQRNECVPVISVVSNKGGHSREDEDDSSSNMSDGDDVKITSKPADKNPCEEKACINDYDNSYKDGIAYNPMYKNQCEDNTCVDNNDDTFCEGNDRDVDDNDDVILTECMTEFCKNHGNKNTFCDNNDDVSSNTDNDLIDNEFKKDNAYNKGISHDIIEDVTDSDDYARNCRLTGNYLNDKIEKFNACNNVGSSCDKSINQDMEDGDKNGMVANEVNHHVEGSNCNSNFDDSEQDNSQNDSIVDNTDCVYVPCDSDDVDSHDTSTHNNKDVNDHCDDSDDNDILNYDSHDNDSIINDTEQSSDSNEPVLQPLVGLCEVTIDSDSSEASDKDHPFLPPGRTVDEPTTDFTQLSPLKPKEKTQSTLLPTTPKLNNNHSKVTTKMLGVSPIQPKRNVRKFFTSTPKFPGNETVMTVEEVCNFPTIESTEVNVVMTEERKKYFLDKFINNGKKMQLKIEFLPIKSKKKTKFKVLRRNSTQINQSKQTISNIPSVSNTSVATGLQASVPNSCDKADDCLTREGSDHSQLEVKEPKDVQADQCIDVRAEKDADQIEVDVCASVKDPSDETCVTMMCKGSCKHQSTSNEHFQQSSKSHGEQLDDILRSDKMDDQTDHESDIVKEFSSSGKVSSETEQQNAMAPDHQETTEEIFTPLKPSDNSITQDTKQNEKCLLHPQVDSMKEVNASSPEVTKQVEGIADRNVELQPIDLHLEMKEPNEVSNKDSVDVIAATEKVTKQAEEKSDIEMELPSNQVAIIYPVKESNGDGFDIDADTAKVNENTIDAEIHLNSNSFEVTTCADKESIERFLESNVATTDDKTNNVVEIEPKRTHSLDVCNDDIQIETAKHEKTKQSEEVANNSHMQPESIDNNHSNPCEKDQNMSKTTTVVITSMSKEQSMVVSDNSNNAGSDDDRCSSSELKEDVDSMQQDEYLTINNNNECYHETIEVIHEPAQDRTHDDISHDKHSTTDSDYNQSDIANDAKFHSHTSNSISTSDHNHTEEQSNGMCDTNANNVTCDLIMSEHCKESIHQSSTANISSILETSKAQDPVCFNSESSSSKMESVPCCFSTKKEECKSVQKGVPMDDSNSVDPLIQTEEHILVKEESPCSSSASTHKDKELHTTAMNVENNITSNSAATTSSKKLKSTNRKRKSKLKTSKETSSPVSKKGKFDMQKIPKERSQEDEAMPSKYDDEVSPSKQQQNGNSKLLHKYYKEKIKNLKNENEHLKNKSMMFDWISDLKDEIRYLKKSVEKLERSSEEQRSVILSQELTIHRLEQSIILMNNESSCLSSSTRQPNTVERQDATITSSDTDMR